MPWFTGILRKEGLPAEQADSARAANELSVSSRATSSARS